MFKPKTEKIRQIHNSDINKNIIKKCESLFHGKTNVYIDFANVRPWSDKLKWHVSPQRLKQFLDSFDNINSVKFYQGELIGSDFSKNEIKELREFKYGVRTKPVKIMKLSINASSISSQSPDLLNKFIRKSLLRKYDIETVEYLNRKFSAMNQSGIFEIEDRKCNFDVEIATDMRVDHIKNDIDTFVLWSGDSDFSDTIKTLLKDKKSVLLFATAGRIASELSELVSKGLFVFDIRDLRDFICWKKELKLTLKSTKDPNNGASQL